MKRLLASFFLLLGLALAPAGCGGGGSSAGSGSGTLGVFVTDAFSDDFDQVWVTIYRVELIRGSGAGEVVFDDPAGRILNLNTLRDASGQRFAFLASAAVDAAALHTDVRITIGPNLTLFARGSAAGQSVPVAGTLPRDAQGRPTIQFPLASPRNMGSGSDDLVIDFDLPRFVLAGGAVTPALQEGGKTGLADPRRHEDEDFEGIVSGLAGASPNLTFTLTRSAGAAFTVATSASTVIFNSNAAPNPVLANGSRVEVRGTFDVNANRFVASAVKIEDGNEPGAGNEPEVRGRPTAVNAGAGTFAITIAQAENFVPGQATVNVVTTPGTVLRSDSGLILTAAEFYAQLAVAPGVEAEGVYNAATNTLLARKAKIDNEDDGVGAPRAVEARGPATDLNPSAGTFTIRPVEEYEGFVPAAGAVPILTNAATTFQDRDNNVLTSAAFFAALTPGTTVVKADGTLTTGGAITARRVRLR